MASKGAISEYLHNLTFQALSQENNKVLMSFMKIPLFSTELLECFVKIENEQIDKSSVISKDVRQKLDAKFKADLSDETKIQLKDEPEFRSISQEPIAASTQIKEEEIKEIYLKEQQNYLKTAILLNQTNLETAAGVAEDENKAVITEIVD